MTPINHAIEEVAELLDQLNSAKEEGAEYVWWKYRHNRHITYSSRMNTYTDSDRDQWLLKAIRLDTAMEVVRSPKEPRIIQISIEHALANPTLWQQYLDEEKAAAKKAQLEKASWLRKLMLRARWFGN